MTLLLIFVVGILISIGALIDESQDHNHINNRACAKSRQVLLLTWLVVGFFISMCYKSVLLANMVNNEYEKPIDTIDDILLSGLPYYVAGNTGGPVLFNTDPRDSVKQLLEKQVEYYNLTATTNQVPRYVKDGYVTLQLNNSLWSGENGSRYHPISPKL